MRPKFNLMPFPLPIFLAFIYIWLLLSLNIYAKSRIKILSRKLYRGFELRSQHRLEYQDMVLGKLNFSTESYEEWIDVTCSHKCLIPFGKIRFKIPTRKEGI